MCQILNLTFEYGDHFVSNCGGHPVPVIDMFQVTKSQLEKSIFLIWPNTGSGEIKTHQASSSHEDLIFYVNTTLLQVHERGGLLLFYRSFKTTTNLLDWGLLVCLNINRLLNGR